MMTTPHCCEYHAYHYFERQLPELETTLGLTKAAIGLSMHALDDVCPEEILARIQELSERVAARVRGRQAQAKLAHLHQVLFEEEGFAGNTENYLSPLNSYLPAVLEGRQGIPVSLSLLYKAVAEPLGLNVQGINAPGHFLVRVRAGDDNMIVDPFARGRILTRQDFARMCASYSHGRPLNLDRLLRPTSHRLWLARMLGNLRYIFDARRFREDSQAMAELQTLLA